MSKQPASRRPLLAAMALAGTAMWLSIASPSHAAVSQCVGPIGTGLCQMNSGWCEVTTTVNVIPGATIDCSGLDVRVRSSGVVLVNTGTFELLAHNLTIDSGRRIEAVADPVHTVGFELSLSGNLVLAGKLIADNAGGQSFIAVQAAGSITISDSNPAISAVGTAQSASGGEVYLIADGTITVGKSIYLHGKDGGDENNINGGGLLLIDAGGSVIVNNEIRAHGRWFGGGDIRLFAAQDVSIVSNTVVNGPRGKIVAEGRNLTGDGGVVTIGAGNAVSITGDILVPGGINNGGGEAGGGSISIAAGCGGVTFGSSLDLTGGLGDGGVLITESDGPIVITGSINGNARAGGGNGGVLLLTSGMSLIVSESAMVTLNGHDSPTFGEDGGGGLALLSGCVVDVRDTASNGAVISATGAFGGALGLGASRSTLGATEWSLHVGDKALLDTRGGLSSGVVELALANKRVGKCSNNQNFTCQYDSECVLGCGNMGVCQNPNPNTDGLSSQFKPVPIIAQNLSLSECTTVCD